MLYRMAQDPQVVDFPPSLPNEFCENMSVSGGKQHDENQRALTAIGLTVTTATAPTTTTRLLCMVYTMADAHGTKIRAIRDTWGSRCDGFLAFSTESDPRLPAVSIPHTGPEAYDNMWQKVRSIWKFVYQHYATDFDYFFLGGDDLFVIPENLKAYLGTLLHPENELHFAGRRFKGYGENNYFNSGGAGYALSRKTLIEFYKVMDDKDCAPTKRTSMEDVMIAQCLRRKLDIKLTDTRDEKGRERFHPFAPATHYEWKPHGDWYDNYNTEWGLKLGKDCCAPDSVSFHYIKKPAMVRHIFALLYHCPSTSSKR